MTDAQCIMITAIVMTFIISLAVLCYKMLEDDGKGGKK